MGDKRMGSAPRALAGEYPVLGNYTVLAKLGEGGMGKVFKAEHVRMKRMVALKILSATTMRSPDVVRRFQREVEVVGRLSHPNIVTAFDADQYQGRLYLVMEYVDGKDLATIVWKHGPLQPAQAVHCLLQAAGGLDYAHRHGVIHRDIKPSNLLLNSQGVVKILDMGLARLDRAAGTTDDELTLCGQIVGSMDYLAPEQARDAKQADARSDIYSLGCTLHFLLTGKVVYPADAVVERIVAHLERPVAPLRTVRPGVPETLDALYQGMIAKRPEDRPQTAAQVVARLEECIASAGWQPSLLALCRSQEDDRPRLLSCDPASGSADSVASVALALDDSLGDPVFEREAPPCPLSPGTELPTFHDSTVTAGPQGASDWQGLGSTVLIVEDDLLTRRYLRGVLEKREYRILEASSGREGLKLLAEERPDLMVLDLGLPDMDGIEVIRQVRRLSETPVLVVSSQEEQRDKVAALNAGADDYLTKPLGVEEFLARIRVALRHAARQSDPDWFEKLLEW